jgi:hypothetical protein
VLKAEEKQQSFKIAEPIMQLPKHAMLQQQQAIL